MKTLMLTFTLALAAVGPAAAMDNMTRGYLNQLDQDLRHERFHERLQERNRSGYGVDESLYGGGTQRHGSNCVSTDVGGGVIITNCY